MTRFADSHALMNPLPEPPVDAHVQAVASHPTHAFSKTVQPSIQLLAGLGVETDAHCGITVKHRSRVARDPSQPNLRQVHLVHGELFDELALMGYSLKPGEIGENITTRGIDLLGLPEDTILLIGSSASLRVTGLRNPCHQLDDFRPGLMSAVLGRTPDGALVRKSGVMAVVLAGGIIRPGDRITVKLPAPPLRPLQRV